MVGFGRRCWGGSGDGMGRDGDHAVVGRERVKGERGERLKVEGGRLND